MKLDYCLTHLESHAQVIRDMVARLSPEQAMWKPGAADWSALEVVNHLADEEREDFRARLKKMLIEDSADFSPIDPVGWVTARGYNQRDLMTSLEDFLTERRASLRWLHELDSDPDWAKVFTGAHGRTMRPGDMLASWVAHDVLHMRQLVELQWAYQSIAFGDFHPGYAGEW